MSEDLARHRQAIDDIDRRVVELLNQRAGHAIAIGKAKGGAPVYRPEREAQVLANVASGAGPLSGESLRAIYREVMSACRALEQSLGAWSIIVQAVAVYFLFGIELTAEAVEQPFGSDGDDLALEAYCETIRKSATEVLS
mgnify:CR=1 FL=1